MLNTCKAVKSKMSIYKKYNKMSIKMSIYNTARVLALYKARLPYRCNHIETSPAIAATTIAEIEHFVSQLSLSLRSFGK